MVECRNYTKRIERSYLILFNRFQEVFNGSVDKFHLPNIKSQNELKRSNLDINEEDKQDERTVKKLKTEFSHESSTSFESTSSFKYIISKDSNLKQGLIKNIYIILKVFRPKFS